VELEISFRLLFRLMWPYSEKVLGNLYYTWNDDLMAFVATDQSGEFVTIAGIRQNKDGIPLLWSSNESADEFGMPSQSCTIELRLRRAVSFDVIIASSGEGFEKTVAAYLRAAKDPGNVFSEAHQYANSILSDHVLFNSPDNEFNAAYRWALLATDRFQVNTPGVGNSLVAGYATSDKGWDDEQKVSGRPGYGWYFGRDGAWSGFALLQYGDFDKVRQMLKTFNDYQDLTGKIFHELSTSGIAYYDAADATPLYIILAGRYLHHSGDSAFIRASWPFIEKAIDFCYSTDTDGDRLIENTNVGHGWEEGGHLFGAHTTLYLASCWAEALDQAGYMADILSEKALADKYRSDSKDVKKLINTNFWNPEENYYYHGLMPDGSYLGNFSIMPAIPMLFGQTDRSKADKVLPVIASDEFTADWDTVSVSGIRIGNDVISMEAWRQGGREAGRRGGREVRIFLQRPHLTGWTCIFSLYCHRAPLSIRSL
jgi:glycogen debranching enzyme